MTDQMISDCRAMAARVTDACKLSDAGVVLTVRVTINNVEYVLWTIGRDNRITQNMLDAAVTNEARLTAHARGFAENHLRAWAA